MALTELCGDEQGIVFSQLCNVLDPGVAVALSSVSNELRSADGDAGVAAAAEG